MLQLQAVCLKRNPKHIGAQALFQVIHLCRLTGEPTFGLNVNDLRQQTHDMMTIKDMKTINMHLWMYKAYMWAHTCTRMDVVTPAGLMRWELLCDSDGATFVKSDSQLRQPGLRDNSLPVRLWVPCSACARVCVCARERVCAHTCVRAHSVSVCVNISQHVVPKSEYQVPILIYLPHVSIL